MRTPIKRLHVVWGSALVISLIGTMFLLAETLHDGRVAPTRDRTQHQVVAEDCVSTSLYILQSRTAHKPWQPIMDCTGVEVP